MLNEKFWLQVIGAVAFIAAGRIFEHYNLQHDASWWFVPVFVLTLLGLQLFGFAEEATDARR
jgi:hypothetical protein